MGSTPKTPPPPDYGGLANQQADIDRMALLQQTIANRPNQKNPFGELKWTMDPDTGQWTQEEVYDPRLQGLADKSLGIQGGTLDKLGGLQGRDPYSAVEGAELFNPTDPDIGKFDPMDLGIGTYDPASGEEFARKYAEAQLARVRPQQAIDQRSMETRLRLQGLQPGTEAYDRAYRNLLTSQGDVNAQAYLQAELAGGRESRDIYGTQLSSALQRGEYGRQNYQTQFEAALRRAENERAGYATRMQGQEQMNRQSLQDYMLPYETLQNEQSIAAAYNTFRPGYQTFTSAGGAPGADMMGAAQSQYAAQVQAANDAAARRAGQGSMWGSVVGGAVGGYFGGPAGATAGASAGGAAGSYFSDAALKENITPISDEDAYNAMLRIVPHSFVWPNGRRGSGLIAQQVAREFPELISRAEQGYLKVDYETFTAILLGAFRHLAKQQGVGT